MRRPGGRIWRLALISALIAAPMRAGADPAIVGDASRAECRTALRMATEAFRATSPSLIWPVVPPDLTDASIVLARKARDISGGDGLDLDPALFDRHEIADGRIVHWPRTAVTGQRLVVVETPVSWQGDWYETYLLDAALTLDDLLRGLGTTKGREMAPVGGIVVPPAQLVLGIDRWNPPVALRDSRTGAVWLIDQGEPYQVMAPWRVFVLGPGDMVSPCRIAFHDGRAFGLHRLPDAVRRFAALADEALGPGTGEGTSQPTARTRLEVAQRWALATERPWALSGQVRSSRAAVDAGLAAWAAGVRPRLRLLAEVTAGEDGAERGLARYYRRTFGLSRSDADRFAAYALDFLFRSHFRFPDVDSVDLDPVEPPWPMEIRERVVP